MGYCGIERQMLRERARRNLLRVVTLSILVASGPAASSATSQEPKLSPEEMQGVVAALEATAFKQARSLGLSRTRVRVADATLRMCATPDERFCMRDSALLAIRRELGTDSSLSSAFETKNATVYQVAAPLDGRFSLVPQTELISSLGIESQSEVSPQRHREFGVVAFSAPAMVGDRGAVYITLHCGQQCGYAWLVTLEKRGGTFSVRTHLLAIS